MAGGIVNLGRICWVLTNKTKGEGDKYHLQLFANGSCQLMKEDKVLAIFDNESAIDVFLEKVQRSEITIEGKVLPKAKSNKEVKIGKAEKNLRQLYNGGEDISDISDGSGDFGSDSLDLRL